KLYFCKNVIWFLTSFDREASMTLTINNDDVGGKITATGSEIVRRIFDQLTEQHGVVFRVGSPVHDPPDVVRHRIEQQKPGLVWGTSWGHVMDIILTPFSFGPSDEAMKITLASRHGHDLDVFDETGPEGLRRLEDGLMFQVRRRIHPL